MAYELVKAARPQGGDNDRVPFTTADVPPGPYFHGTRAEIAVGESLRPDTVNPSDGDNRLMVWATTDADAALVWAKKRNQLLGGKTLYVYEVELDDPEIDTNWHQEGETGSLHSVMAPTGTVTRVVQQVAETRT